MLDYLGQDPIAEGQRGHRFRWLADLPELGALDINFDYSIKSR
jgi:hypothetical protein